MLRKICVRIVCIERAVPYNAMRTDECDMAFADLMRDTYINCPIAMKVNSQGSPQADEDEDQHYYVGLSEVVWKQKGGQAYNFNFKFKNANHNSIREDHAHDQKMENIRHYFDKKDATVTAEQFVYAEKAYTGCAFFDHIGQRGENRRADQ